MADLFTLMARLEALEAAKHGGTMRVDYEDRTVVYRSLADMDQLIRELKAEIAQTQTGTSAEVRLRQVRIIARKGV